MTGILSPLPEDPVERELVRLGLKEWPPPAPPAPPDPDQVITMGKALLLKHLPGHHNQLDHGRRGGSPRSLDALSATHDEMMATFTSWGESLPEKDRAILNRYQEAGFKAVNTLLRTGKPAKPSFDGDVDLSKQDVAAAPRDAKTLARLTRQVRLPRTTKVFRGMRPGKTLKVGDSFTDRGFTSTSIEEEVGSWWAEDPGEVLAEVTIPEGSHALYMDAAVPKIMSEREVLLPNNGTYTVTGIEDGVVQLDYREGRP